jgi:hypothetical protein
MQERSLACIVPVAPDVDAATIGKTESGQVDGIGARMPAQRRLLTVVDIAAGVTADVLDDPHRRA